MLRGEVGVGLTTLLDYALRFASDMRIVRTPGAEAEQHLAFAGVHSLCHAMPGCLDELPGPHRDALASAFGLANRGVADPFLVGQAVLALLSTTADDRPLLCVIDDAQWLDKASVNALAFVARRLSGAPVAMLLAAHDTRGHRSRLPNISVGALPDDTARELLASIVDGPLDRRVRERIVQETGGIPLGLVEVTARLSSRQLAGIFELPDPLPIGDLARGKLLRACAGLPTATRTFLLLAAADPRADARVLWRAAERMGLDAEAAQPAEVAGVLRVDDRIVFRTPLVRLALYDAAPVAERQRVHRALADVIDADVDPDRWVWHRAAASLVPDEEVARELESSAARAKGQRDYDGALCRLERAIGLTPDAGLRYKRALAAAQVALAGGAVGRASALLDGADPQPGDEVQSAQADRLRGAVGLALGQGLDRAAMLLRSARAFETVDAALARDTYIEAIEVAAYAGRLSDVSLAEVAPRGPLGPGVGRLASDRRGPFTRCAR